MKVKTTILNDGIVCETEIGTRHYRSKYKGYTLKEAKQKFISRVLKAEQEELDKARLLALAGYLKIKEKSNGR